MAQRKCEKCGSTDFVREGGYDVCQYCGTRYPVTDAPAPSGTGGTAYDPSDTTPVRTPINVQINMSGNAGSGSGGKNSGYAAPKAASSKSWSLTLILAIFFGYFGIHRFYVGKLATGAIWFCTAGCFFIGWIGDIWKIAIGKFTDGDGRYIVRK